MRRTALLVTTVATLVIGLASCSSETPGEATPGDDSTGLQVPTEGGDGGTTEPPETSESETDSPADSLEPCELLSSDDQSALSLGSGEEESLGGARTCLWQASGSHTVSVDIWNNLGIDEVQSKTKPQPKNVGSHQAVQYTGDLGVCVVAIELTESSRVDVGGVAGGDIAKACDVANQAAELVEPKLP